MSSTFKDQGATPAAPAILAWNSWSCMEISVNFLPSWTIIVSLNLYLNHYNFFMTIYSYLFSRGFLSIWPHICRYRRPRPSGDLLLCILAQYTSCDRRQSGGNTWQAIMYHIVNGKVGHLLILHVSHHLYLQVLDQLHLALIHLRHSHLDCLK